MSEEGNTVVAWPKMFSRPRLTIDKLQGRMGRFAITDETLHSWPDIVLQIMGQVIVMKAGHHPQGFTMYIGISALFEVADDCLNPPGYEWCFEGGVMRPYRVDRENRDA